MKYAGLLSGPGGGKAAKRKVSRMEREIKIEQSSSEENQEIHRRLRLYNRKFMRDLKDYNFHISDRGQIVAGIVAGSVFDTLEVEFLFVEEAYRGQGLGSSLLEHAERLAREDGMKRVLLNTYSFQAPDFYKAAGYRQLLEIAPCFGEFSQYYFMKELTGDPARQ